MLGSFAECCFCCDKIVGLCAYLRFIPLDQALAAGLGGRALVAAFAALCLNHKHFAGGLPDLLLMRAVRMRVPASNSPPTENAAFITAGMEMSMVRISLMEFN